MIEHTSKIMVMKIFPGLLLVSVIIVACKKEPVPPPFPPVFSVHGGTTSHNNGQVCMTCHTAGGPGPNNWIVAGSVFQPDYVTPAVNGTLFFWSQSGGTGDLIATLQVDGLGNFFTTSSILPGTDVYPQIQGAQGDIRNMPIPAPNGNCSSCHGVTQNPIWVN
jgi:hypothetical protein